MSKIHVLLTTDADGKLHFDIPTTMKNEQVQVTVIVEPVVGDSQKTPEEMGWSPGFFERTAGRWQGEFVREQPEMQERDWSAFD